jgi:uncharacterized membrane protein
MLEVCVGSQALCLQFIRRQAMSSCHLKQPSPTSRIARSWLGALLALLCGTSALAQSPYRLTIIDGLGSDQQPVDINNNGQMVLGSRGSLGSTIVVWDGAALNNYGVGLPMAINNNGEVVGLSVNPFTPGGLGSFDPIATLWTGTTTTVLSAPATSGYPRGFSLAADINDGGQVVGSINNVIATTWQSGNLSTLGAGQAASINEDGAIVGSFLNAATGTFAAGMWDNGSIRFLDGGAGGFGLDINNGGQVIGRSGSGAATLWDGAATVTLAEPGGGSVSHINNRGQIVGNFLLPSADGSPQRERPVLWAAGAGVELNSFLRGQSVDAGWVLVSVADINDSGTIVGTAYNRFDCSATCQQFAFVLSVSDLPDQVVNVTAAIPEPSTYALMFAGLGAIGLLAQRRRKASASR